MSGSAGMAGEADTGGETFAIARSPLRSKERSKDDASVSPIAGADAGGDTIIGKREEGGANKAAYDSVWKVRDDRGVIHKSSLRIRSIPSRRSSTSALQSESGAEGEETDEVIAFGIVLAPATGANEVAILFVGLAAVGIAEVQEGEEEGL